VPNLNKGNINIQFGNILTGIKKKHSFEHKSGVRFDSIQTGNGFGSRIRGKARMQMKAPGKPIKAKEH
jgi:hypothetical protein